MKRPLMLAYGPNPYAPERYRWAACMVTDGRPGTHWMSTGPTEADALAKLEALWARSIDKRKVKRKPTSEPVASVVHVADDDVVI